LGGAFKHPFREAGHVVASDDFASRTFGTAEGPLLRGKRETEPLEAELGVADAIFGDFSISRSCELAGR
jgi:hypothetical protein